MAMINKKEKAEPLASAVKAEKAVKAPEKAAPVKAEKAAVKAEKAVVKAVKAEKIEKTTVEKRASEPQVKLYVQYMGGQISGEEAVAAVKAAWTGAPIETLELYVKPEDNAVYYVVNGGESGKVEL